MQNMVTLYGAGEKTGIFNVEGKLGKALGKDGDTLVVKAADRDTVLNEISARAARYDRFDPEMAARLRALRTDVRDVFNKGTDPGVDIMDQLWFLDSQTKDLVEKMSRSYNKVVTPDDFKTIAKIMSAQLSEQVPILKDFTKFFGKLAQAYLTNAKPSSAAFDFKEIFKAATVGSVRKSTKLPTGVASALGLDPSKLYLKDFVERLPFWNKMNAMSEIIFGSDPSGNRRTGTVILKRKFLGKTISDGVELLYANKLPKSWTNVPWVNFDGKTIEQNFTQSFEEKLMYRDKNGKMITSIVQVNQKTESGWWDVATGESGKINDIADATRARTAYAVNGNHSNDAVIVKKFHLWGKKNNVPTSTIHDAFFANAAVMTKAREGLREIYAEVLKDNVIEMTLKEMLNRGLPREVYNKFRKEAIDIGLIPVAGRSRVGGKLLTDDDILKALDILEKIPEGFTKDRAWYGVG